MDQYADSMHGDTKSGGRKPLETSAIYFCSIKTFFLPAKNIRIDTSLNILVIANEQAERRLEVSEAASLMPREVLQQAEKFSIVLWKV